MSEGVPENPTLFGREADLGALVVAIVDVLSGRKLMARAGDGLDPVHSSAELINRDREILHRSLMPVRLVAPSG
jgi:hypothetical protein